MRMIQSAPFHLYCLCGPDRGMLIPLFVGRTRLGRGVNEVTAFRNQKSESEDTRFFAVSDPATADYHAVFVLEGAGETHRVVLEPAPGCFISRGRNRCFSLTWLRQVGESVELQLGDYLQVGLNYWQFRAVDSSYCFSADAFAPALSSVGAGGRKPFGWFRQGFRLGSARGMRSIFIVFPLISLTSLLFRWFPPSVLFVLFTAFGLYGVAGVIGGFFRRYGPLQLGVGYIGHLPVNAALKTSGAVRKQTDGGFLLSFNLPALVSLKRFGKLGVFMQPQGREMLFPAGRIAIESKQARSHALCLGLLTMLRLEAEGYQGTIQVSADGSVTVRGKLNKGALEWVFTAYEQNRQPVDLRLQLVDPPVLGGEGLLQQYAMILPADIKQASLSVAQLRQLTLGEAVGGPGTLRVPVGMLNRQGDATVYWLDLVSQGPHALITGTTGSGKSVALRTLITQLCDAYSAQQLQLVLFDYKGGTALREFLVQPHTQGLITDLDGGLARRVFAALQVELQERERALARFGYADLQAWQSVAADSAPPRLLCIVDEFRAMQQSHPQDLETLLDLAARGRSLGIHLVLATQSAAGVLSPQMRANINLRVAFRTATLTDSLDVLGCGAAFSLAEPGSAYISAGGEPVAEGEFVRWAWTEPGVMQSGGVLAEDDLNRDCAGNVDLEAGLWRRPLLQLSAQSLEGLEAAGGRGRVFAWGDWVSRRSYLPLFWDEGVVALVTAPQERFAYLQACGAEKYVNLGDYSPRFWWVLAENARYLGVPLMLDDLYQGLQSFEGEFGLGSGRDFWDFLVRSGQRILVGVSLADFSLCKSVSQVLLAESALHLKQAGLGRELVQLAGEVDFYRVNPVVQNDFQQVGGVVVLRWAGLLEPAVAVPVGRFFDVPAGAVADFTISRAALSVELEAAGVSDLRVFAADVEATERVFAGINNIRIRVESPISSGLECAPFTKGESCGIGFQGLNAAQLAALKVPKYAKNLCLDGVGVWLFLAGKWVRYTG